MEVQAQYGDRVEFVGIPSLGSVEQMDEFIADTGVSGFVHIPDTTNELWTRFGVQNHRTYVLVDADGTMRTTGYGSLAEDVEALAAG